MKQTNQIKLLINIITQ